LTWSSKQAHGQKFRGRVHEHRVGLMRLSRASREGKYYLCDERIAKAHSRRQVTPASMRTVLACNSLYESLIEKHLREFRRSGV
jgi:hypothetical protein